MTRKTLFSDLKILYFLFFGIFGFLGIFGILPSVLQKLHHLFGLRIIVN